VIAPGASALLLAGAAAAALLTTQIWLSGALALVLLALVLRAPAARRWPYLLAALVASASVFVLSPLLAVTGTSVLWSGPVVPVLGVLDVTSEEVREAALFSTRLLAVSLAFAVYALRLDHDTLLAAAGRVRRSAFIAVLAIRLVPSLERDAYGLAEAVRGRGIAVEGVRARSRLISPLVAGSLERALNLAESMEARGFGRAGRTRLPGPRWRLRDRAAVALAVVFPIVVALWL
jgi:energy-coupling factor transport system permease protein